MLKKSIKKQPVKKTNWLLWGGIAAAVIILLAVIFVVSGNNQFSAANLPAEITVDQAHALYTQGDVFFLDVREVSEWNDYHAPNTTLIPLGELAARVNEIPKDKPIVVVCRSGNRSQQGRDILKQAGFTNVTSMAGGLKTWQSSGYPTVSGP